MDRSVGRSLGVALVAAALMAGCGGGGSPSPLPGSTSPREPSAAPSSSARPSASSDPAAALVDAGPYAVGVRTLELPGPTAADRAVRIRVFYPAITESDQPAEDAPPDSAGAPYPVVLGDSDLGPYLAAHLASPGLAYVEGVGQRTWGAGHPTASMVDYPLDLMAALDGLSGLGDDSLAAVVETDRAGVVGYSFGAWTTLVLAGARVDPDHYRATCADRPDGWSDNWWGYVCGSPAGWEAFVARGIEAGVATETGLWLPFGDERIRAVVSMMPEGYDLVGQAGIASATAAALFLAGSADVDNDYDPATLALAAHYPAGRAATVTFVGGDHSLIFTEDGAAQIRRLTTLFLAAHLRDDPAMAEVIDERWVTDVAPTFEDHPSYETLVWGVIEP